MAKKHDEVMAMTDVELRFKASELMGITDGAIPDYPNDIVAAWELVDAIADKGERGVMVRFDSFRVEHPNNPNWTVHVTPDIRMDVDRKDVPRAITRAFILAMDDS